MNTTYTRSCQCGGTMIEEKTSEIEDNYWGALIGRVRVNYTIYRCTKCNHNYKEMDRPSTISANLWRIGKFPIDTELNPNGGYEMHYQLKGGDFFRKSDNA